MDIFILKMTFLCIFVTNPKVKQHSLGQIRINSIHFETLQVSPAFLQPLSRGSFERRFSLEKQTNNQWKRIITAYYDTRIHLHNMCWIKFVSALRDVELLKVMRTNFWGTELTQPRLPRFSNLSEPFWPTHIWCSRLAWYHHASIRSLYWINSVLGGKSGTWFHCNFSAHHYKSKTADAIFEANHHPTFS